MFALTNRSILIIINEDVTEKTWLRHGRGSRGGEQDFPTGQHDLNDERTRARVEGERTREPQGSRKRTKAGGSQKDLHRGPGSALRNSRLGDFTAWNASETNPTGLR